MTCIEFCIWRDYLRGRKKGVGSWLECLSRAVTSGGRRKGLFFVFVFVFVFVFLA